MCIRNLIWGALLLCCQLLLAQQDGAFLNLDQDFTSEITRLQDALQRIDSRGGTALYDAASMSLDHLKKKGKTSINKRALLVISDGEDNASRVDLETLVRELQETDATIYAIGLLTEEERRA